MRYGHYGMLGSPNRALGNEVVTDALGTETVYDTFTCGHCNKAKRVPHGKRPEDTVGKVCSCCQRVVCTDEACMSKCDVIEKKLERSEALERILLSRG